MNIRGWLSKVFRKVPPPTPPRPPAPPRQIVVEPAQLAGAYAVLDNAQAAATELSSLLLQHELKKAKLLRTIMDADRLFDEEIEKLRATVALPPDVDYTLNLPDKRDGKALFVREPAKK